MLRLKWKNLRLLTRQDSGQSMVETAICAFGFILLLFGALDFGYLYYAKVTLQNAVRQGARYAVTGNCSSGACFNSGNNNNRLDTIINTVTYYSFNLAPTVAVTCAPASGMGSCSSSYGSGTNNAGGPGDFITVGATYTFYPIIIYHAFANGSYTFTVTSSFKNESFAPAPPPS